MMEVIKTNYIIFNDQLFIDNFSLYQKSNELTILIYFFIKKCINMKISLQLFDYKITIVNSQQKNTKFKSRFCAQKPGLN